VIEKQHAALMSMHASLQCQVCLELLTNPYVLGKCGHVCCQTCLESWFRHSPQAGAALLYGEDGGENDIPLHLRQKSCPHCRAAVRVRPVPLYLIKGLTGVMSAPGLLDKSVLEIQAEVQENATPAVTPDDPWEAFFPNVPRRGAGLLVDEEDGGVIRCEDCFYEVVDGQCVHCGRLYDIADAFEHDGHALIPWLTGHLTDEDFDEDEDDESELSYEGSFIDDHPVGFHLFDFLGDDDDDDDESLGSEDERDARIEEILITEEEEEDGEGSELSIPRPSARRRLLIESEEDQDEDEMEMAEDRAVHEEGSECYSEEGIYYSDEGDESEF